MKVITVRETILKPNPESRIREREAWKQWNPDRLLDGIRDINMPYPNGIPGEWYEARVQREAREAAEAAAEKRFETILGAVCSTLVVALYVLGVVFMGA